MVNCAKDIFIPPLTYLQNEGYGVMPLVRLDALKTYDRTLHIICLWATIRCRGSDQAVHPNRTVLRSADKQPGMAPVLVFIDEKSFALTQNEDLKNISFISKSFDVRQLDANIPGIIDGAVVRLVKQNADKNEKVSADKTEKASVEGLKGKVQYEKN